MGLYRVVELGQDCTGTWLKCFLVLGFLRKRGSEKERTLFIIVVPSVSALF